MLKSQEAPTDEVSNKVSDLPLLSLDEMILRLVPLSVLLLHAVAPLLRAMMLREQPEILQPFGLLRRELLQVRSLALPLPHWHPVRHPRPNAPAPS